MYFIICVITLPLLLAISTLTFKQHHLIDCAWKKLQEQHRHHIEKKVNHYYLPPSWEQTPLHSNQKCPLNLLSNSGTITLPSLMILLLVSISGFILLASILEHRFLMLSREQLYQCAKNWEYQAQIYYKEIERVNLAIKGLRASEFSLAAIPSQQASAVAVAKLRMTLEYSQDLRTFQYLLLNNWPFKACKSLPNITFFSYQMRQGKLLRDKVWRSTIPKIPRRRWIVRYPHKILQEMKWKKKQPQYFISFFEGTIKEKPYLNLLSGHPSWSFVP